MTACTGQHRAVPAHGLTREGQKGMRKGDTA